MSDVRIIDTDRVMQDGRDIKNYGSKMYDELKAVQKLMHDSKEAYDEDSGDQLRLSFDTIAKNFEEFKKLVDDYGDFLIKYAEHQIEIDKKLKANSTLG